MKNIFLILLLLTLIHSTERTYILCEGDYYTDDASLWMEQNNQIYQLSDNPIGNIGQSMTIFNDQLFVILNGSSKIIVYNINQYNGNLDYLQTIDTFGSGPRELFIVNNFGFLTEWNTQTISILDLNTFEIINSIPIDGLPESIVTDGEYLYVSIILNSDWSTGNLVISIDLEDYSISNYYNVGLGPNQMIILNNIIYISRTYYDNEWDEFTGTSSINLATEEIFIQDYGINNIALCGSDIASYNDTLYRTWNGGIAMLDENLEIIPETQIGGYEYESVYSMAINGDEIYIGLTDDFLSPDEVVVLDFFGNVVMEYSVGAIPGSYAFWNSELSMQNFEVTKNDISLLGNYPNPFNPKTNITFYLKETSNIDLIIYNLLGQEIYRDKNTIYPSGYNTITFVPKDELSGFYIYEISTKNASKTSSMMIIK